jgi:hypothetical protein
MALLKTTDEVIDALGGNVAVSKLTHRTSDQAASNWRQSARNRFPRETYLIISNALLKLGHHAPASLWGFEEPASQAAE